MAYPNSPNLSNVPDLTSSPYYDTSLGSPSPSPQMMYNSFPPLSNNNNNNIHTYPSDDYYNSNQILDPQYLARRAQQQQQQAAILASVEFTDLTNPVYEDRRRRKSSTSQDKQAISSMGIRRRAQNRASQRAFRDRKEKHVQHLETELSNLESKFRDLQNSHTTLGNTNEQLKNEVETLKGEIKTMRVLGMGGMPSSNDFDALADEGVFEGAGGDWKF
ncbi:MAG: hypothetical protein Q9169_005385 [Polycauliona sp. 2 TL-2023]